MTKNKKQNREQNEVSLFLPNFKPASNQTKIQNFFLNYFYIKNIRKIRIVLEKKIFKKVNKRIKIEKKNEDRQNKNRKN